MGSIVDLLVHKLLVLLGGKNLLQLHICLLHVLQCLGTSVANSTFVSEFEVHTIKRISNNTIVNA